MIIFDIVVLALLVVSVISGLRRGLIVQAIGLVSIIIGVAVAVYTGASAGEALGIEAPYTEAAGFLCVFAAVTGCLVLAGWLLRKVFKIVGLGLLDSILGVVFSLLKLVLVLSVLCSVFNRINDGAKIIDPSTLDKSLAYRPLCDMANAIGILKFDPRDVVKMGIDAAKMDE